MQNVSNANFVQNISDVTMMVTVGRQTKIGREGVCSLPLTHRLFHLYLSHLQTHSRVSLQENRSNQCQI